MDPNRWIHEKVQRWRNHRRTKRGWYDLSARCDDDAIFIGGCGRSGTTLFRELLNRHSRIACGPETSMFGLPFDAAHIGPYWEIPIRRLEKQAAQSRTLVEFAARFYREYLLAGTGKSRWADKTPNNVRGISRILTWFPNGRFLHIVRDGRDVACSLRHHPRERVVRGRLVPVHRDNPIADCARRWLLDTSTGVSFEGHPRYAELRYERLVSDPEGEMRRALEFLGEEFEEAILDASARDPLRLKGRLANNPEAVKPITSRSVGRWRRDLSPEECRDFHNVAGELLIRLGYATDDGWVDERETHRPGPGGR